VGREERMRGRGEENEKSVKRGGGRGGAEENPGVPGSLFKTLVLKSFWASDHTILEAGQGGPGRGGGRGGKYPQKASLPEANAVSCFSISVPGMYLRRGIGGSE